MSQPTLVPRRRTLASLLVAVACAACQPTMPAPFTGPAGPADVVGTLAVVLGSGAMRDSGTIALPDVELFLQDSTQAHVAGARSQLDGRFHLRAPGGGAYRVCWNAPGFGAACGPRVVMHGADEFVGVVPIRAERGVVHGRVLTADARACWVNDPFFRLDVSTRVTLLDAAQAAVGAATRANVYGEYAFGGVAPGAYTVVAECERATQRARVRATGAPVVADLTLPNRAPRFAGIAASDGGRGITAAAAGAVVQVNALVRDVDGDPVRLDWRLADAAGTLSGGNGPLQTWTLDGSPRLHVLYVMASDGRGGYAYRRFDLPVGAARVGFSGRVVDEATQAPVAGARVEVGTGSATTNASGWFTLSVPPATAPARYVLNVRHPRYALLSRVHDRAAAGNSYELIRVQTTTHDPSAVIDVVDTASSGPCGARRRDDQTPCRHRGARLVLPAGALVDSAGNAPAGPVTLAMATLNPARRALPGDYRAVDRNDAPAELLSFGAVYAEFRGPSGAPLRLRSGSPAEVRVPVSDAQRRAAAPTIAMWSYDEARGLWVEEGQAGLQNTEQGVMYVGTTTTSPPSTWTSRGTTPPRPPACGWRSARRSPGGPTSYCGRTSRTLAHRCRSRRRRSTARSTTSSTASPTRRRRRRPTRCAWRCAARTTGSRWCSSIA
ncbi:Carboxypeptidase regulatory-like domain-containing protein [bacterium JGI 053]|nr:Carboxypeptidase regulatory-like domain-containing protein [bacterium JGI 053]